MNKYAEIENALRKEFSDGKFIGGAFPSEHMLMKRFSVARGTVRQALSRLEADGLIKRRRGSGTTAQPRVNPATGRLGLLIPDMDANMFFRLTTSKLVRHVQEHGYVILLGECAVADDIRMRRKTVMRFVRQFVEQHVEGVIFRPFMDERLNGANLSVTRALRKAGIPLVLIDSDIVRSPARSDFDLVAINHVNTGRNAARMLYEAGCDDIYFMMPQICSVTRDRLFGVAGSVISSGLEWNDGHVLGCRPDDIARLGRVFGPSPERSPGVVCGSDSEAVVLIKTLSKLGLAVPRDVSVVGCDDTPEAEASTPAISTFHQPIELIAKTAIEVLRGRIRNPLFPPRAVLLDAPFVARMSVRDCHPYPTFLN